MTKEEFLNALRRRLAGLPQAELEERLAFWGEMIDDRIEDGLTEEVAVRGIGSVEEVATQIIADVPLASLVRERAKPRGTSRAWVTVLLVLGSPVWLSLAIAAFAVLLSVLAALWSVAVTLWALTAVFVGCAIGGVAGGVLLCCLQNPLSGIALCGAGLVCAGLAILWGIGCRAVTGGLVSLTRGLMLGIKKCFVGKERTV